MKKSTCFMAKKGPFFVQSLSLKSGSATGRLAPGPPCPTFRRSQEYPALPYKRKRGRVTVRPLLVIRFIRRHYDAQKGDTTNLGGGRCPGSCRGKTSLPTLKRTAKSNRKAGVFNM